MQISLSVEEAHSIVPKFPNVVNITLDQNRSQLILGSLSSRNAINY